MLAKLCGSGSTNCLMVSGASSEIKPFPLSELSYFVFEGEFSVESDKEELVSPALGLYSLIIKQRDQPHMKAIYEMVQLQKDRFFPPSWTPKNDGARAMLMNMGKTERKNLGIVRNQSSTAGVMGALVKNASRELFRAELVDLLEGYVESTHTARLQRKASRSILNAFSRPVASPASSISSQSRREAKQQSHAEATYMTTATASDEVGEATTVSDVEMSTI